MKIAFFTEMGWSGKVPRDHPNARTEFAWMCALDATHHPIQDIDNLPAGTEYDLGVIIIPKNGNTFDLKAFKKCCTQVAVMQEGPNWYWQDYEVDKQIWYYNTLMSADVIFAHNLADASYYRGLTLHSKVHVMPSLMIEQPLTNFADPSNRKGVIVGGNFCSWYGGFDSYVVAAEFNQPSIYAPHMGRKKAGEEQLIQHLPYMPFSQWIAELSKFKYGVHLMRTHAAGTFALNCAFLGIPCIGYRGLDTQEVCHPNLTVEVGDLIGARVKAKQLTDPVFYQEQAFIAKMRYTDHFSESCFITTFNQYFK